MTDRIHALTVVLDQDIREDELEPLVGAILMLRNVLSVEKNVSSLEDHVAKERALMELRGKLIDVLYPQREANR